jgi:hypothetical protein
MTNFTKIGTPKKCNDYFYFNYGEASTNQPITYRVKTSSSNYSLPEGNPLKDATVFIDPNKLSPDGKSVMS